MAAMDPELRLDLELMAYDFTLHEAIVALIRDRRAAKDSECPVDLRYGRDADRKIQIAESMRDVFRSAHGDFELPGSVRFREQLYIFLLLFVDRRARINKAEPPIERLGRYTKSLARRVQNRTDQYYRVFQPVQCSQYDDEFPLPLECRKDNALWLFQQMNLPESLFADWSDCLEQPARFAPLHCLLPLFIELVAVPARAYNWEFGKELVVLIGEFMMQSVLEQYLVLGGQGTDVLNATFAWGWHPDIIGSGAYDDTIQELFQYKDEGGAMDRENPLWTRARQMFLEMLLPDGSQTALSKFRNTAAERPYCLFESRILKFLEMLTHLVGMPLLLQANMDRIDGLTEEETLEFKKRCGLIKDRRVYQDIDPHEIFAMHRHKYPTVNTPNAW